MKCISYALNTQHHPNKYDVVYNAQHMHTYLFTKSNAKYIQYAFVAVIFISVTVLHFLMYSRDECIYLPANLIQEHIQNNIFAELPKKIIAIYTIHTRLYSHPLSLYLYHATAHIK